MSEASTSTATFGPDLTDKNRKHDRILKVGEKKFYVNKTYVSAWSQYLNLLLNGDFVEQNQIEIEIKEVDSDLFELFLKTIHPGGPDLTYTECLQLLELERFLSSEPLVSLCFKRILKLYDSYRTPISAREGLEAALEFRLDSMLDRMLDFACPIRRRHIREAVELLAVSSPQMAEELQKIREPPPVVGIMNNDEYDRDYRE